MIQGFSPVALNQLASVMGGGSVKVVIDLSEVEAQLSRIGSRMTEMLTVLTNPDAAAGDEKLRKGALAVRKGWYDDAVGDLEESIVAYRYRALPHLLLGWARLSLGESVPALRHLSDAVKYARADEARAGLTAALLGAALLDGAGQFDAATALLRRAVHGPFPSTALLRGLACRGEDAFVAPMLIELMETNGQEFRNGFEVRLLGESYQTRRSEVAGAVLRLQAAWESAIFFVASISASASSTSEPHRTPRQLQSLRQIQVAHEGWLRHGMGAVDTVAGILKRLEGSATRIGHLSSVTVDPSSALWELVPIGHAFAKELLVLGAVVKEVVEIAQGAEDLCAEAEQQLHSWPDSPEYLSWIEQRRLRDEILEVRSLVQGELKTAVKRARTLTAKEILPRQLDLDAAYEHWTAVVGPPRSKQLLQPLADIPIGRLPDSSQQA